MYKYENITVPNHRIENILRRKGKEVKMCV